MAVYYVKEEERRAGVHKREHGPVLENSNSVVGHPQEGLTIVLQRVTERGVVGELQVLRIPSTGRYSAGHCTLNKIPPLMHSLNLTNLSPTLNISLLSQVPTWLP